MAFVKSKGQIHVVGFTLPSCDYKLISKADSSKYRLNHRGSAYLGLSH